MELNSVLEETINGWILDYAFWQAWKEFKSFGSVDSKTDRDFLEACIRNPTFPEPYRNIQIRFLHLLTRLADGLNYSMSFNDGTGGTVLESGYYHFSELMSHFPEMLDEFADISCQFLQQAVFVCCIDNNFSMAKTVFNRLGSDNILKMKCFSHREIKATEEEIKAILSSKNSKHPTLIKKDYCSFITKMIELLETIYKSIPEPLLIRVYKDEMKLVFEDKKSANCGVLPNLSTNRDDRRIKDKSFVPVSHEVVNHSSSHELESGIIDENSNSVPQTAIGIGSKGIGRCCSSAKQKKLKKTKDDIISELEKAADFAPPHNHRTDDRSEISSSASLDAVDKNNIVSTAKRQKLNEIFQYLMNCHRKISPESIRILKSRVPSDEKPTSTEILKATIRSRLQKLGLSVEDFLKPEPLLPGTPATSPSRLLAASQSILETPRLLKVMCVPMEKDKSIPECLRREIKKELLTGSNHKRSKQFNLHLGKNLSASENDFSANEKVDVENSVVQTPVSRLPTVPKGISRCRKSLLNINNSQKENSDTLLSNRRLSKRNLPGQGGRAWTKEEEMSLYKGIVKYGPGKWAFIRDEFDLKTRSVINISDKWRNLKKNEDKLRRLKRQFQLQMKKL